MKRRPKLLGLAAALFLAAPALAQEPTKPVAGLERINHIIVIYLENRSFDQLYGLFPGADGVANAGAAGTQVDRDGKPYDKLPPVLNTNYKPPEIRASHLIPLQILVTLIVITTQRLQSIPICQNLMRRARRQGLPPLIQHSTR